MTSRDRNSINPGAGVPQSSLGTTLQRGGEELALEKISNRFTVHLADSSATTQWAGQIPAQHSATLPNAQLEEFVIDPAQRDRAMQEVRASEIVRFASHVYRLRDTPGSLVYLSDRVTVQFAPQVEGAAIAAIANAAGLHQLQPVAGLDNTFVFQLTAQARENPLKITNRLMARPEVLLAEPNIVVPAQPYYHPRDSLYSRQWYLHHNGGPGLAAGSHIAIEAAWDITRGKRSIVIAISDDSFDLNHPDFKGQGKVVAPRDLRDRDFQPLPSSREDNHGTACAGIAIAEENGNGIVGVAPGCAFMPIRTTGFLDDASVEDIFDWAIQKGADVISCSWGPSVVYFPLSLRQKAALTRAATQGRNGKGCVIVFAAGNANRPIDGTINERDWPNNHLRGLTQWLSGFAVHPDVVTVSACTSLNQKAAYSNWGIGLSVCAPSNNAPPGTWLPEIGQVETPPQIRNALAGQGVFTTDRLGASGYNPIGDFTGDFGGTSSACPIVAGVAALVLSVNSDLTAAQVKRILQQSTDKIVDPDPDPQLGLRHGTYNANGYSQWFGYGKVNALKAVKLAQSFQTQPPAPTVRKIQGQNNTARAIPDDTPQGTNSAISITATGTVQDIQVNLRIDHSFLGDLEISLIAPNGQVMLLQGRTLGRLTRLQKTYTLQTTPILRKALKQSAQGAWRLKVVDRVPLDTGTLRSWQLTLTL